MKLSIMSKLENPKTKLEVEKEMNSTLKKFAFKVTKRNTEKLMAIRYYDAKKRH